MYTADNRTVKDIAKIIKKLGEKGYLSEDLRPTPKDVEIRLLQSVIDRMSRRPQGTEPLDQNNPNGIHRQFNDDSVVFFIGTRLEYGTGEFWVDRLAVSVNQCPFIILAVQRQGEIPTAEFVYLAGKKSQGEDLGGASQNHSIKR